VPRRDGRAGEGEPGVAGAPLQEAGHPLDRPRQPGGRGGRGGEPGASGMPPRPGGEPPRESRKMTCPSSTLRPPGFTIRRQPFEELRWRLRFSRPGCPGRTWPRRGPGGSSSAVPRRQSTARPSPDFSSTRLSRVPRWRGTIRTSIAGLVIVLGVGLQACAAGPARQPAGSTSRDSPDGERDAQPALPGPALTRCHARSICGVSGSAGSYHPPALARSDASMCRSTGDVGCRTRARSRHLGAAGPQRRPRTAANDGFWRRARLKCAIQ